MLGGPRRSLAGHQTPERRGTGAQSPGRETAMNAEQARFLTEYLTGMIEQESATTAKVLAAVPDSGRDYKPDPKSRTAWELATHLAASDVWFLQSIIDGAFIYSEDGEKRAMSQIKNINDLVAFYKRELPPRLAAVRT